MKVLLSWPEVILAGNVGVLRQVDNLRKGRQSTYGFEGNGFASHIDGAGYTSP